MYFALTVTTMSLYGQEPADAVEQRVLSTATRSVKGREFPKLPPMMTAKTAGCCQPGDTRNVNGVATIDLSSPKGMAKSQSVPSSGYMEAIYSPPLSCWTISTYNRHVISANDPYEALTDAQPANFHYLTHSEYTSTLEEMKNYVAHLDIAGKYKADLSAKLESFVKSYSSYANDIQTSHGQVRHRARVLGRGMFNGSSWYKAEMNTTEICCPLEVRDQNALRQTLKGWVDDTASKLPRRRLIDTPMPMPPPVH